MALPVTGQPCTRLRPKRVLYRVTKEDTMKFMSVREFRQSTAKVWEALDEDGEIILTNNGQPRALIVPVTEEIFEEMLDGVRSAHLGITIRQM